MESLVATPGIEICIVRKWTIARDLEVVELQLRYCVLKRIAVGLGYFPSCQICKAKGRELQYLFKKRCTHIEEVRVNRMMGTPSAFSL